MNRPENRSLPGYLLGIAYLGFVSLGLPDAVAAVAWPEMRCDFHLPLASFGWLFMASGLGYFFSSFFAGRLTQLLSVGNLLTISSVLVGIAMLGFSQSPLWWMLVACAVLWGLGSGAIDAALNGYVASHFSARHVSWLHACYSTGATLGPLIMTFCIVQAQSWRWGYAIVGFSMLTMSVLFLATSKRWSGDETVDRNAPEASMFATLRAPVVWIQIAAFFLYTGLENTAGQWSFTLLEEGRGVSKEIAGILVSTYYASIAAGRIFFGIIAQRFGLDRLVRVSTLAAIVGTICIAIGPVTLAAVGLVLLGLGLASIFPTLMTRTPQRLGPALAAHAIGFQVSAAMLGSAILPSLTGLLAEQFGLETIGYCTLAIAVGLFVVHEFLLKTSRDAQQ